MSPPLVVGRMALDRLRTRIGDEHRDVIADLEVALSALDSREDERERIAFAMGASPDAPDLAAAVREALGGLHAEILRLSDVFAADRIKLEAVRRAANELLTRLNS